MEVESMASRTAGIDYCTTHCFGRQKRASDGSTTALLRCLDRAKLESKIWINDLIRSYPS